MKDKTVMKKTIMLFSIVLSFVGGCIFDGLITYAPKDAVTRGRIKSVERRIRKYYKTRGMLPKDMAELRMFLNEDMCFGNNAWGKPILYVATNNTSVVLLTYGPGGDTADVRQEFRRQFDVADDQPKNVGKDINGTDQ